MAHPVRLASLTVGRCFYLPPAEDAVPDGGAKGALGNPLANPDYLFRVDGAEGAAVSVTSARGVSSVIDGSTLVAEVPRAGFDRVRSTR